mgnify:CR=1 FL=1
MALDTAIGSYDELGTHIARGLNNLVPQVIAVSASVGDMSADVAAELHTCGGPRVPCVVFLSEDGQFCGRYGDRTLSKYRKVMSNVGGAACPTGLLTAEDERAYVVQDWLNEFERIHAMLRTSSRLRQKHGD